jgi:hypothetical protein
LDRQQTIALLKELLASNLLEPTWISLEKSKENTFKLKIKTSEKTCAIQQFFSANNLMLEEVNGYWLISKP